MKPRLTFNRRLAVIGFRTIRPSWVVKKTMRKNSNRMKDERARINKPVNCTTISSYLNSFPALFDQCWVVISSILAWVCTLVTHRWCQNVIRTKTYVTWPMFLLRFDVLCASNLFVLYNNQDISWEHAVYRATSKTSKQTSRLLATVHAQSRSSKFEYNLKEFYKEYFQNQNSWTKLSVFVWTETSKYSVILPLA